MTPNRATKTSPAGESAQPPDHAPAPTIDPVAVFKQTGSTGILAVLALVLPPLGSILLFWAMAATDLGPFLRSHGLTAAAIFALVFALLAGLAVLTTYAQCALAGWAFGVPIGLSASLAGFAGGALIGYLIARRTSGNRINAIIASQPKWQAVKEEFLGRDGRRPGFLKTTGLVALLRFPPNSPFALTNLVMATVHVPIAPYLVGTALGMAPRSALAVVIGAAIQQAFNKDALASAAPAWVPFVAIATAIVVVLVIGAIANRALTRLAGNIEAKQS